MPKRLALLIGIDYYLKGDKRPDIASELLPLRGCVRDVKEWEEFLKNEFSMDEIKVLVASEHDYRPQSDEANECLPTYRNIIKALKWIEDEANSGDYVYIHYSGHGARVATTSKEKRERRRDARDALDETLVPMDILDGGKYLRDFELGQWLSSMSQRGLKITITLDCCHSGGGVRGMGGESALHIRGALVDDSQILEEDYVSDLMRGHEVLPNSGSFLKPNGYELIAACHENEKAHEDHFSDTAGNIHIHGALSYYLLKGLKTNGTKQTFGSLRQYIRDEINRNRNFTGQTPAFAGNTCKHFFDGDESEYFPTFTVIDVRQEENEVVIMAGAMHGVTRGTKLDIYPQQTKDFSHRNRLVRVEVDRFDIFDSNKLTAKWVLTTETDYSDPNWKMVKPYCRAKLCLQLGQNIHITMPTAGYWPSIANTAIEKLRVVYVEHFSSKFELSKQKRSEAQILYEISVDNNGMYMLSEFSKSSGKNIVPNFPPCPNPKTFLERVERLVRHQVFKRITNIPAAADNNYSFACRVNRENVPAHSTSSQNYSQKIEISDRESVNFSFKNHSSDKSVNLTILDFTPLWGVVQILPKDQPTYTLGPGEEWTADFTIEIPDGVNTKKTTEMVKAFITYKPIPFEHLVTKNILEGPTRSTDNTKVDIEDFFAKLSSSVSYQRDLRTSEAACSWAAKDITIEIVQNRPALALEHGPTNNQGRIAQIRNYLGV